MTEQISNNSEQNIVTQRLIIRRFVIDDASFIVQMLNDVDFIRNIRDSGVRTIKDAQEYLHNGPLSSYVEFGFGLNCVIHKHKNLPIGMCGILQRDSLPLPDIGFSFLPEYRGQAFALESSKAVIEHAKTELGLDQLLAIVDPQNSPSVSLLIKLGFELQKVEVDNATGGELATYHLKISG